MDGTDEQHEQQQNEPEAPKLSAAFLPYDDERLWVGMPQDQRGRKRPKKRRPPKRSSARAAHDGSPPTRTTLLSRPVSFGRKQIAAAVLTLALPISAFAVTGAISGDVEIPNAPIAAAPTLVPSPIMLDLVGLRAERVSAKRVELSWDAPEMDGPLTYSIYRDGVVIAETDGPSFVDTDVEPQRYYYYAVATVGSDGRAAASPQLLVAVPSETGELPEGPAPAAPAPIIIVTSPSPSPSKSPSPTKSKVVWPSTDFGGGGGGGSTPCDPTNPNGACYSPPACDPTDPNGACYSPPTCDPTDPNGACYSPPTCDPTDPNGACYSPPAAAVVLTFPYLLYLVSPRPLRRSRTQTGLRLSRWRWLSG